MAFVSRRIILSECLKPCQWKRPTPAEFSAGPSGSSAGVFTTRCQLPEAWILLPSALSLDSASLWKDGCTLNTIDLGHYHHVLKYLGDGFFITHTHSHTLNRVGVIGGKGWRLSLKLVSHDRDRDRDTMPHRCLQKPGRKSISQDPLSWLNLRRTSFLLHFSEEQSAPGIPDSSVYPQDVCKINKPLPLTHLTVAPLDTVNLKRHDVGLLTVTHD
jgi:hypothetical protein